MKIKSIHVLVLYIFSVFAFSFIYFKIYNNDKNSFSLTNNEFKSQIITENEKPLKRDIGNLLKEKNLLLTDIDATEKNISILESFFTDSSQIIVKNGAKLPGKIILEGDFDINIRNTPFTAFGLSLITSNYIFHPTYFNKHYSFELSIPNFSQKRGFGHQVNYSLSIYDKKTKKKIMLNHALKLPNTRQEVYFREVHETMIKDILTAHKSKLKMKNLELIYNQEKYKILSNNLKTKNASLNYLDFVYFSLITQSSTGYGDILPNNRKVRLIVIIQILISVLLLSFVLNMIVKK